MIQHCIAHLKKRREEKAYQAYVTDALKVLTKNTANHAGSTYLTARYVGIIDTSKPETRTQEEIVERIRRKIKA